MRRLVGAAMVAVTLAGGAATVSAQREAGYERCERDRERAEARMRPGDSIIPILERWLACVISVSRQR